MGTGPAVAIPALLKSVGLNKEDIDLFEVGELAFAAPDGCSHPICYQINEAFASMYVYCLRKLELDPAKVNVNGGAIALGHPLDKSSTTCIKCA